MKHYIIERQESPEARKQPVAVNGKTKWFASPKIAAILARLIKREMGGVVTVSSKGHEGPQEVIEV
jgi:hypothetical protein